MVALAGAAVLSLGLGAVRISPRAIALCASHPSALSATERLIVFQLRLPRVLAGAIVGAALATAGLLFQGLFRNALADPYVTGSSGGSVVGAALGIFVLPQSSIAGFSLTALLAFAGSTMTMAVVYTLARSGGRTHTTTLLLAGFAVSTILTNSLYFFEVLDTSSGAGLRVLTAWLRGAIEAPTWAQLGICAGLLGLGLLAALPLARALDTLALGDEYAQGLGINVERTRVGIVLAGSLLTAVAVSLGGLISFAGLVVPHAARLLLGPANTRLLPVSVLGGALLLVLADTLARVLFSPQELPVGTLMALVGGPFFLYLLRRGKRSA